MAGKNPAKVVDNLANMVTVYMSESDVARDLHAVLVKVKQGIEVVIEQDHRPVAVLKAQQRSGCRAAGRNALVADAALREAGLGFASGFILADEHDAGAGKRTYPSFAVGVR